ncbi:MAG TPA: DNA replication/repair protein RecF [Steroidobacteraceae bacterium]|nr:DNA replication/repair protein RecF [Steroidobacteraceae bacterium]
MSLVELSVEDLRCLEQVHLQLHPTHNLIWGSNGSGKTSVLEAIFFLGRGRSFRTRNSDRLIRRGQSRLIVFGRTDDVPSQSLGVQVMRDEGVTARINAGPASALTDLSQAFAVAAIDPGVHKLVEEGAHRRRRWMDWVVFHVEPHFVEAWTRYTRALKQRNAALKSQPSQAGAWDSELVRWGEQVAMARHATLQRLQPFWKDLLPELSGLDVELHYFRGWSQDTDLQGALRASLARDLSKGATHPGPHRADILVRLHGRLARETLSRGQQKLVAITMMLAQVRLVQECIAAPPTLLLDDPAAELDSRRLERFIARVEQLRCQTVLTSLERESPLFTAQGTRFHVEQGRVAEGS